MSDPPTPPTDVVLLHSKTEDGEGARVVRVRKETETIEVGEVRPLREGKPINGEVVNLRPRPKTPWICDVDVAYAPTAPEAGGGGRVGPAQVATTAYRTNWDTVFGPAESDADLDDGATPRRGDGARADAARSTDRRRLN